MRTRTYGVQTAEFLQCGLIDAADANELASNLGREEWRVEPGQQRPLVLSHELRGDRRLDLPQSCLVGFRQHGHERDDLGVGESRQPTDVSARNGEPHTVDVTPVAAVMTAESKARHSLAEGSVVSAPIQLVHESRRQADLASHLDVLRPVPAVELPDK